MNLDEKAGRLLRELDAEAALSLIAKIDDKVRNPNAFITKQAGEMISYQRRQPQQPAHHERIEAVIADLRLDDSAAREAREMDAEAAQIILERIESGDAHRARN